MRKQVKQAVLIICMLATSSVVSYASNILYLDNVKIVSFTNGDEKMDISNYISADISGHKLTVAFSQNLGEVSIDISTASGATIFCLSVQTPTGYQLMIPCGGSYTWSRSRFRTAASIMESSMWNN